MNAAQVILQTVTVAEDKGRVHILSYGSPPFALVANNRRGQVLIPNGFKVRSTCSAREWEFETRVLDGGAVEYQCVCVEHPTVSGGWRRTASMAYVETNKELIALGLGNGKFRRNENGALLIGVTYRNVQRELQEFFAARLVNP